MLVQYPHTFEFFTSEFLYHVNARLRHLSISETWPDYLVSRFREMGMGITGFTPKQCEELMQNAFSNAYLDGEMGKSVGVTAYRSVWLPEHVARDAQVGNVVYDEGYACASVTREGAEDHLAEELREGKGVPSEASVPVIYTVTLGYGAILLPGEDDPDPVGLRRYDGNIANFITGQYVLDKNSVLHITHNRGFPRR